MIWNIISIILIIIVGLFVKFFIALEKQRRMIASQGGISIRYKHLVDGLLACPGARVIQDNKYIPFINIAGHYKDPIMNDRECGYWSVTIQPVFKFLYIEYKAHNDLEGGIEGGTNAYKKWNFPIDMDQKEILAIVTEEANEWNKFGIFRY